VFLTLALLTVVFGLMNRPLAPSRWGSLALVVGLLAVLSACGSPDADPEAEASASNVLPEDVVQQQVNAARERLSQNAGGELVLRAIDAHGGLEAWYRAPTSSYTWEYANTGADVRFESFMVVDNQTRRAYHDLLTVGAYDDAQPVDARFAWDGERAWIHPDTLQQPNPHFWALSGYYFEQIPFVLADPGLTYERLPDDTLDGTTYHMVTVGYEDDVGYSSGDTYTLYVHPETDRVDAIRYTVSYGRDVPPDADLTETLFTYEDYVTVHGLTVPTHFEGFNYVDGERGDFKNEAHADSISFRRSFDASRLDPPEGARIVTPPPKQ
jgi:hypothetical protein